MEAMAFAILHCTRSQQCGLDIPGTDGGDKLHVGKGAAGQFWSRAW